MDLAPQGKGRRLGTCLDHRDARLHHGGLVAGNVGVERSLTERGARQVGAQRVLVLLEPDQQLPVPGGKGGEDRRARSAAAAGRRGRQLELGEGRRLEVRRLREPHPRDVLADDLVLDEDREHLGGEGGVVGVLAHAEYVRRAAGLDRALVAGVVNDGGERISQTAYSNIKKPKSL